MIEEKKYLEKGEREKQRDRRSNREESNHIVAEESIFPIAQTSLFIIIFSPPDCEQERNYEGVSSVVEKRKKEKDALTLHSSMQRIMLFIPWF